MMRCLLAEPMLSVLQMGYGYRLVCYYEDWSQYRPGVERMTPADIDPNLCTHINYAFANLTDGVLAPKEWNDFSKQLLKLVARKNDATQKPKLV